MSLKNTDVHDRKKPKPMQNINNNKKQTGKIKWQKFNVVPVQIIIMYNGTKVNKKFIPENKHFDNGKIYLGIYTLLISPIFDTIEDIHCVVASLKKLKIVNPINKQHK